MLTLHHPTKDILFLCMILVAVCVCMDFTDAKNISYIAEVPNLIESDWNRGPCLSYV